MPSPPVTILGAGIAGLTLGRCLLQRGIQSVIYDRAPRAPRHTYGITLEPRAYEPLLSVLKLDESTFRHQLAVDSAKDNGVGRVTADDGSTSTPFRANRYKLESMLREHLTIYPEHKLTTARAPTSDQAVPGVELEFENGTTIRPNLIVDALGVHSPLRIALLPSIIPTIEPLAVFNSKKYVPTSTFDRVYSPYFANSNVLTHEPESSSKPRLEISVNSYLPEDSKVSISYIYSRSAHPPNDELHNPNRSNNDATKIPEAFYHEVESYISNSANNIPPPFKDCFDATLLRNERVLHWLMRIIIVPQEDLQQLLENSKVVMIGDSVHAVPILGGHGANMAIVDAVELAEVLTRGLDGDLMGSVAGFYEGKWKGWRADVEESRSELERMHSPKEDEGERSSNL